MQKENGKYTVLKGYTSIEVRQCIHPMRSRYRYKTNRLFIFSCTGLYFPILSLVSSVNRHVHIKGGGKQLFWAEKNGEVGNGSNTISLLFIISVFINMSHLVFLYPCAHPMQNLQFYIKLHI